MLLLSLALLACRADEASDLLDYEPEVEVAVPVEAGDDAETVVDWTISARRPVLVEFAQTWDTQEDNNGEAAVVRFDYQESGEVELDRADALDVGLYAAVNGYDPDILPAEQVIELDFYVSPCRWLSGECDRSRGKAGTLDVVLLAEID